MRSDDTGGGWTGQVALVLGTSTGGIGRHVASLAAGLIGRGATVTVYGPVATENLFGFADTGATFAPIEIPASPHPRDAGAIAVLRHALNAGPQPRVVHAHGMRAGFVAAATTSARPLVVTWHNAIISGGFRGRAGRFAERYVARRVDVALGASFDLVERAAALGARDARLGPVAAPPLPPPSRSRAAVRSELGIAPDAPMVLSVGRLHPQKSYPVLVEAATRWRTRHPVPVVVIAGSGPGYLDLAAQISDAHAPVRLLGHRTDVADLLAAADLAVVTSAWEARQLFTQEALRAGVPLVATAVGGIPELVAAAAVLIAPSDVDALDAAVTGLLDDPDLRARLAAAGPRQAATWPTEDDMLDQLVGVYAELATAAPERR